MYVWQIPSACPMTGILVLFIIYCTNAFEPLGMSRSTDLLHDRSSSISLCWLAWSMQPSGAPFATAVL